MRQALDRERLETFLVALGRSCTGAGAVYLTGGATALWYGWRSRTLDVDLRLDPEPPGAFAAIARLKDELDLNVELASPADFLPPVPGWRARSVFVGRYGSIEVFHYDPVSQVLAKISRGYERDQIDASAMVESGWASPSAVRAGLEAIRPALVRVPRLDEAGFVSAVELFLAGRS